MPNNHVYFYGMSGVILSGPTLTQAGPRALVAEGASNVLRDLPTTGAREGGVAMFVKQILSGTGPPASVDLALTALATVEAGLRSVSENRRVAVSELLD